MNLKKVNDFFGYSLYAVGALRIVLIILTFLNFGMSFADLVNQSDLSNTNLVTLFAGIIGIAQIILAIAAVVMIFVNLRKEPKVVKGYLYSIGAILIEIFAPSFLMIIFIFFECSLYMKAGTIIVKSGSTNTKNNKRNEEMAKNSEWFFDKEREANRIKRTAENNIEENIEGNVEPIKGISISNILIAWIVVIAVILVVYLIQDMRKDEFANEISNAITNQNIPTIDNDKNTLAESRIPVREESNTSSLFEVEETDERLIGIVNKFNNSEAAANMFIQGYILTSIASGNELIVYGSGAGVNTNVTYTLNGDILSTVIEDDIDSRISVLRVLHAMFLLDSVGQYKGYPERTIINAFNEEKSKYYTIENEGIELKEDPVTGDVTIKVDLSKDFSFLNNN